jgi:hypothetical protein
MTDDHERGLAEPAIRAGDRFKRAAGVSSEQVGPEGILHDAVRGRVHVLNATAMWIWDQCVEGVEVEQLTARFAQSCEKNPAKVAGDVHRLLGELSSEGLVERVARAS